MDNQKSFSQFSYLFSFQLNIAYLFESIGNLFEIQLVFMPEDFNHLFSYQKLLFCKYYCNHTLQISESHAILYL